MDIKGFLIDRIAKAILGGTFFDSIKNIVETLVDADMDGETKNKEAKAKARLLFADVTNFALNLGIELALALIKHKTGVLPNEKVQK